MEEKLNIIIPAGASNEEVTDSIADLLRAVIIAEKQMEDGFQLIDLFEGGLQLSPIIMEVVKDAPVFWDQFKKLTPEMAMQSVTQARDQVLAMGQEFGTVSTYVARFLFVFSSGFDSAMIVKEQADRQVNLWKTFVAGEEVFE